VVDFIFVLDTLNFCFWPHAWEYDNLATSLKMILEKDPKAFSPENLLKFTFDKFKSDVFLDEEFPLL